MAFDLGGFLKKRWDTSVIRDAVSSNTAADQQRRQVAAQKAAPVQQPKVPYYGSFSPQVTNTEQAVQQTGRDLGRQQREGQITGQQFTDKFSQLLASTTKDAGYKTPMAQAGNFAKGIVKPFWETGDTAVKGAQLGVANLTNNQQAADKARQQRDQSYQESLVAAPVRAYKGVADTPIGNIIPGNTARKNAEKMLEDKLVEAQKTTENFTSTKAKEIQDGIRNGIYDPQKGQEAIQQLIELNGGVNNELGQFYRDKLASVGLDENMSTAQSYAKLFGDQASAAGLVIAPASGAALKAAGGNVIARGVSELGTNSALNALGGGASAYGQGANLEESLKAGATQAGVGALMMGAGYLKGIKGPAAVETNIPAAPGSLRESIQAAKQNVRLAINNPDGANVFKINNPLDAKTTGLDINNPMGAQTKPLDVRNPLGAETGKKLSIVDRYKQATDIDAPKQDGFVRNPLANDAPQGKLDLSKLSDDELNAGFYEAKNNTFKILDDPQYRGKDGLLTKQGQKLANIEIAKATPFLDEQKARVTPAPQVGKTAKFDDVAHAKANEQKLIQDYKKNYPGKMLNTDDVRESFKDVGYNRKNAADYHEGASHISNLLFDEQISTLKPGDKYLFMAGSSGAGKSHTLATHPQIEAGITAGLDGNFSSASAMKKLDRVIATGAKPTLSFVERDPLAAWQDGVMKRAIDPKNGRVVPLDIFIDNYFGSRSTVLEAAKKYGDKIELSAFKDNVPIDDPIAYLSQKGYNKSDVIRQSLQSIEDAKAAGKIDEATASALVGKYSSQRANLRRSNQEPQLQSPNLVSKPTLQDALEGKSTKAFTPLSQPVDSVPAVAKRVAPVESQTRAQLQDGAFKQISGRATPVREKGLLESFQASNAPQDLKDVLGAFSKEERTHLQKSNKKLWNDAQRNVYEDPVSALDYYHKNHNDESVARGYALIERYNKLGDTKAAGELGMDMAERALKAGRETQAYALMKKMTPQGIVAHAERKVAKFIDENPKLASKINFDENVRKDLADRVDKITKMDNGRERNIEIGKMQEVIDNIFPSSIADKAITLWKAGLLTSLRTHERNIIGNAFNGAGELSAQTIGSPIDRLMALRTGKRTTAATLGGYGTGSKEGAVISKDLIKTGVDTTGETLQKYNTHHITWGNGIGGKFAKGYTQSVFRTLGAEDKPFRMGRQANSMHSQALAEASNLGLRGAEKRAFVNKFTKEVNDAARQEGKISTFAEDTAIGDAITKGKSALKERNQAAGAVAEAVVPFSQVPASVATQLLRYSPAGLAKGIYDVGKVLVTGNPELQRKAALAFGRGATGTAIMGAGALLMSKGLMTGDYPTDPREKAQWELERKQPNSIMVGGKWKSINSVGPQTVLALAGGKVEDELSKGKGTLVEKKDAAINSFGYIGKQFSDQTFVKGLTNFTDAFTNPNRKFESYVEGQVTSVIPNIVKDVAKGTDSTVREISSLSDKIKTSIPGLSGNLTPQRDVFGNEIKREGGIIGATTDLFNSKTPQSTTTIRELDRIAKEGFSATPARTDKNVTIGGEDIKLEPKHIGMIEAVVGPIQKKAMVDIMNSPNYSKYNDQEKSDVLKDVNAVVEPVESLRVARDNKLIDQATFEKAVGNLNKSQIEYLKTGTIPVAPVIRKDKETNQAVASLFDKNNNNSATTGVQFTPAGKTKAQSEFDVASSNRDLTMTRAKANNDLNAWNTAAAEEYDAIGQQIKALDPKTDQVKINTLIKKQEALQRTALGYKANGYIKKTTKATGKGSKGGKFTIPTSSVASSARTSTFTNLNRLLAGTTKTNSNKGKIGNKVALRKITVKGVKS